MPLDPSTIAPAHAPQIELSDRELTRLAHRLEDDYNQAKDDHATRMRRFTRAYKLWRSRTNQTGAVQEDRDQPDYRVPVLQWQVFTKLAKEVGALFGEDSEVVAKPTGPADQKDEKKISCFATWLLFVHMSILHPAIVYLFRKILFGRAIAYAPWVRETFDVPLKGGGWGEETAYEGPGFYPEWPDNIITPTEDDAQSIHDFSFVIRKYRATPNDLLRDVGTIYNDQVEKHWDRIVQASEDSRTREDETVKLEKDLAEGVIYEGSQSQGNSLIVHEWYGRWRPIKGKRDAAADNWQARERREAEWVVRYLPQLHLIIGVQDLALMYPRKRHRRPFLESALVRDGSYWCAGYYELIEAAERHLTRNNDLSNKAGAFSVGPMIFYRPAAGFDPATFEYEPMRAVATDDPNGVKVVEFKANQEFPVLKEQQILGHVERVTGQSDMNMGRSIDRPNAPKTARQTIALLEEGDIRGALELTCLREDWRFALKHFWELYTMYGPRTTFFRVTEQQAGGLFDVQKGGAYMTQQELGGHYDFSLKFATSAYSKETKKQNELALYQIDLQNPLVQMNARALWYILDRVHRAMGDDQFASLIPMPPDPGLPKSPDEEHTLALQGEDIAVNPMDEDQLHLLKHRRFLEEMKEDENRDLDAMERLTQHAHEHIMQLTQKRMMAHMATSLAQSLSSGGGGLVQGGPPAGLTDVHALLGEMVAGNDPAAAVQQQGKKPGEGSKAKAQAR